MAVPAQNWLERRLHLAFWAGAELHGHIAVQEEEPAGPVHPRGLLRWLPQGPPSLAFPPGSKRKRVEGSGSSLEVT